MFSAGGAVVGVPLPEFNFSDGNVVVWSVSIPDPVPREWLIRPGMSFAPGVINKDGALLTDEQVGRLLEAESRRFQPRGVAGCYSPHNAFVFYDAEKKPVAFLKICFDCLGARASPEDPGFDPDYYALAMLCTELKLPSGLNSKSAKQVRDHLEYTMDPSNGLGPHTTWRPPPWIRNLRGGAPTSHCVPLIGALRHPSASATLRGKS